MKKIISLAVIFLFAAAVNAQSTVNADKKFVSTTTVKTVEITSVAIPMDQIADFKIDSENYHKAVNIQDTEIENKNTVEIVVEVKKTDDQKTSLVKKEAVTVNNSKAENSSKSKLKEVEIKAAAVKK